MMMGIYDLKTSIFMIIIQFFCFGFVFLGFMMNPRDLTYLWLFQYFLPLFLVNIVFAVIEALFELNLLVKEANKG
jgi:hypothetical protein